MSAGSKPRLSQFGWHDPAHRLFASGRGSNLLALHDEVQDGRLPEVELALVVCDRPGAPVVSKVLERNLPIFVFAAKDFPDKAGCEQTIHEQLAEKEIDFAAVTLQLGFSPTCCPPQMPREKALHPPAFSGADEEANAGRFASPDACPAGCGGCSPSQGRHR